MTVADRADEERSGGILEWIATNVSRLFIALVIPVVTFWVLLKVFIFLRDSNAPEGIIALVAIVWGVGGVLALFFVANLVIEQLGDVWKRRLTPFVFVGPAMAILTWYLFIPVLRTLYLSFWDADSINWIWLQNYQYAILSDTMRKAFLNNLMWLVLGTGLCVSLGLVISVLADRTKPWFETLVKSLIFIPMSISLVGAGVIWLFVYAFRPAGADQIGILNAILTGLGGEPQAWLFNQPWNTLLLIVILVWLQTGYAMVILSAAIKGIPHEILEASRIDGATEIQIFFRIMIPYVQGTIVTVATTIAIFTLKVFDIVFTMTGGNFGTEVIANQFYVQMFRAQDTGKGAALAIVLLIAVLPVVWYNLRQFGESEAF